MKRWFTDLIADDQKLKIRGISIGPRLKCIRPLDGL